MMCSFVSRQPHVLGLAAAVFLAACGTPESESPSTTSDAVPTDSIVAAVANARQTGAMMPLLTERFGEFSLEEAYGLQDAVIADLRDEYGDVIGYKIGYASEAAIEQNGLEEPAYGPLFEAYRVEDGGTLNGDDFNSFIIETEVAFMVDSAIESTVPDVQALKPYIRSVHAGLDIGDNVFQSPQTPADFVANAAGARNVVVGPPHDPETADLTALNLTLEHNGEVKYEGPTTEVMGDPWNAMLFIANHLVKRGRALQPGDIIISGKVGDAIVLEGDAADGTYVGRAGSLGEVSVTVE